MNTMRPTKSKLALTLGAALAGGSLCGDCQTTFKDAVVAGTREFVLHGLLNPANFIPAADTTGGTTDTGGP